MRVRHFACAWAMAACACAAGAQAIHYGHIWLEGPSEVLQPNTTYTIEAWGRWESPDFIDGTSAMAGFGIDVINTVGAASQAVSVGNVQWPEWTTSFAQVGAIVGTDLMAISGGQAGSLFNPVITEFDLSNPILLFTFDFTTADAPIEQIAFEPMNPNPNGGLSFYPTWQDGASIIAPNDPGTGLHLSGWVYRVPAPGTLACVGAGVLALTRRMQ